MVLSTGFKWNDYTQKQNDFLLSSKVQALAKHCILDDTAIYYSIRVKHGKHP